MSHNKIQKTEISKFHKNDVQQTDDWLAVEVPLEIRLGHENNTFHTLAITMCSPHDIECLVVGYLFTENIISQMNHVVDINIFDNELGLIVEIILVNSIDYSKYLNQRHGMIHASCGVCGKTEFDELLTHNYPKIESHSNVIASDIICSLPNKLNQHQQAFAKTGGLHASALFDLKGELILVMEDIGRHNALDKLIGSALQRKLLPLNNYIILLSGRVSFELVHKSLIAGVTTLAAIGAPSSLSVEIAKVNNLCMMGFIKSNEYNIYNQ